jgi:thiamine biosynthesis lipoprotein
MSPEASRGLPRRQALRITAVAGVSLALGGGLVASLLRRAGLHRVSETRLQLGTIVTVTVVHPEADEAREMVGAAFGEIERLEAILSRYRPSTPVATLNREGVVVGAPAELVEVTARALEYARITGGAFDVTVAPLLDLYARAARSGGGLPGRARVEEALARVDYRALRLEGSDIAFERPGMALTLDGIAKGYVVDRTARVLASSGAERVMVDAGGDIAATEGHPSDDPWRIAIQDPRDEGAHLGVLQLRGQCVASSGDYVETFTQDRRLHHILDPRTGFSPERVSGATVVARSAMDADALSTSVFVLGPEAGLDLLEGLDDVEGMIVTKDQRQLRTRGLARLQA